MSVPSYYLRLMPSPDGTYSPDSRSGEIWLHAPGDYIIPISYPQNTVWVKAVPNPGFAFDHWHADADENNDGIYESPIWDNTDIAMTFSATAIGMHYQLTPIFRAVGIVQRTVLFSSAPISVTATIGGTAVQNGQSIQVPDGSSINVSVPTDVNV